MASHLDGLEELRVEEVLRKALSADLDLACRTTVALVLERQSPCPYLAVLQ